MHKEILTEEQFNLLGFVSLFKREYYLAGGTAIALQIGHRKSIDFDLFKFSDVRTTDIKRKIVLNNLKYEIRLSQFNQLDLLINNVKFTFLTYPFHIVLRDELKGTIKMPDLLTLSAMKAYALGRRAKWKDYVDLFFIFKYHCSIKEVTKQAYDIFKDLFIEKQFRAQLGYFDDINYSEKVIYAIPDPPADEEIKAFLSDLSSTI
jgi:hypothetical protein